MFQLTNQLINKVFKNLLKREYMIEVQLILN